MLNVLKADESAPVIALPTKAFLEETRRLKEWLQERVAASKRKPSSEVITLTPALAGLLLECNPINRPINKRNSLDLAADIASGRFEFNGESIVISDSGILLDGQHRCQQVIATNRPIETVVVFGPKEKARFTIDSGKSKTVSNYLAMKGRAYTQVLGPAINYYLQWSRHGIINVAGEYNKPTKAEILIAADEIKGVDESVEFTYPTMKTIRSHAVLAFCHFVFRKKAGREAADNFILRLIEGDNLKRGDPLLYCRNRLLNAGIEVRANSRIELVFKCWNAHRLGHGVEHCKLSGGKLPKLER